MPSSIERRKRLRPYWYRSLSVFMTYASTVESTQLVSKSIIVERIGNTFPPRRSDGNPVSGLEKLGLGDGIVHLGFKDPEEAVLAYLLPSLRAPQDCFRILAEGTAL